MSYQFCDIFNSTAKVTTQKFCALLQHLQELSCAAAYNKMYVVINLHEKEKCDESKPGCPNDRLLFYNTNIVFDRNGKIIAK